jgi:hypothetical protein
MNIQTTEILRIFLGDHLALLIGRVIAERNILSRFAFSSRRRPVNLVVARGNGNMVFTQKLQIANSHRSPQSQTKTQP